MDRIRPAALAASAAIAALVAVLATGCAASGDAAAPSADATTIADSKGGAQLIRNLANAAIDVDARRGDATMSDRTVACDPDSDPEGLERRWESRLAQRLLDGQDVAALRDVVDELERTGWVVDSSDDGSAELSSPSAPLTVVASTTPATGVASAELALVVAGPCVTTGGPDSDEVKHAEGRAAEG
jgi:hypothetical protein